MTTNTHTQTIVATSGPSFLLRLEGLTILCAAVVLYYQLGYSWLLFAILLLAPDLAMLPYLLNPRWGAWSYNAVHTYFVPLAVAVAAYLWAMPTLLAVALIWLAHIGMDRTVGYGLKYADNFKHTHLQEV